MAEPFLSEIRIMSFAYAPKGWAMCNGQLLPINQNQALFSLLGTTFGGDGRVNFALPDLRGHTPIDVGSDHTLGERGGEQAHTLSIAELPTHTHVAMASPTNANVPAPGRCGARGSIEHLPGTGQPAIPQPRLRHQQWGEPGPSEHAAVPDAHVLHRLAGHLPVTELKEETHGTTLCR